MMVYEIHNAGKMGYMVIGKKMDKEVSCHTFKTIDEALKFMEGL